MSYGGARYDYGAPPYQEWHAPPPPRGYADAPYRPRPNGGREVFPDTGRPKASTYRPTEDRGMPPPPHDLRGPPRYEIDYGRQYERERYPSYEGPPPPRREERDFYQPAYDERPRYRDTPPSRPVPPQDHFAQPYSPYANQPPAPLPTPVSYGSANYAGSPARGAPPPGHAAPRSLNGPPIRPMSAIAQSVIFLGLPVSCDEAALRVFLEDFGAQVDSTTIIYDRESGQSKRFGFARFASVEHARAFVEPNFPSVVWHDRTGRGSALDEGLRIKIDYSQTDKPTRGGPEGGSQRKQNYDPTGQGQAALAATAPTVPQPLNDGTRDIGTAPCHIVLIRGLDPLTNQDELGNALAELSPAEPNSEPDSSLRRVLLVKDRKTTGSWCFAFAIYRDVASAVGALTAVLNPKDYPQGFRIRNRALGVTFAHSESFRPAYATSQWSFKSESGQDLLYWDDKANVAIWENPSAKPIDDDADADAFMASIGGPKEEEQQENEAQGPNGVMQMLPPIHITANGITKPIELSEVVESPPTVAQPTVEVAQPANLLPDKPSETKASTAVTDLPKVKNTTSELIASKKAAPNIAKWNVKQQELAEGTIPKDQAVPTPQSSAVFPEKKLDAVDEEDADLSYGDTVNLTCLLCQRKFGLLHDLKRHTKLSNLHNDNLQKPAVIEAALQRKAALAMAETSQYRDRAAERRKALGQPDVPPPEVRGPKRARHEPPLSIPPAPNQAIEETNIGHRILSQSGWTQGTALGTGPGVVDPIQARMFAGGAGIGASKGVAVGETPADPTYWNSAQHGREKARERFTHQ